MSYRTALVRQMVLHFAELAGWEGIGYTITLNKSTFDKAAKRGGAEGVDYATDLGATLVPQGRTDPAPFPITWIDPAVRDFRLLTKICAHEALHAARPTLRHGRGFDKLVTKLTRGQEP